MEITRWLGGLGTALILCGCAVSSLPGAGVEQVYVADFRSDAPASCRPSDVALSHAQAAEFFRRASAVDYKTLHDNYEIAPCHIEGTARRASQSCDWKIRPQATGSMRCGVQTTYFACDTCADLFSGK